MAYEMAKLIQADLASLTNDAQRLGGAAIAPAHHFGAHDPASGTSFTQSMMDAIGRANQDDREAGQRMAAVDSGQSDDLVGAMLSSQQANLSFSMLMQVRNKVMGAVEELIKLPL